MDRAHEAGCGARVLSPNVALVSPGKVVERAEHRQAVAEALNPFERRRHFEIDAFRGRSPLAHVGAISDIDRRKPRRAFRFGAEGRRHRIQKRKGYGCTHTAKERPPWQSSLCNYHSCLHNSASGSSFSLVTHLHRHCLGKRNAHHDLLNQGCEAVIVARRTAFDRAQCWRVARL